MRVAARANDAKTVSLLIGGRFESVCMNRRAIQRDMQAVSAFGCLYQTFGRLFGNEDQQERQRDKHDHTKPAHDFHKHFFGKQIRKLCFHVNLYESSAAGYARPLAGRKHSEHTTTIAGTLGILGNVLCNT